MAYGLLLDKSGTIFVPTELDRFAVRQIEKFSVMDGGRVEAEFVGMYRDFGAFLIRAKTVTGEPAALAEKAPFPRGRIYYTLSVRQRFGQRYDEVEYDRYLDVVKGYKEVALPGAAQADSRRGLHRGRRRPHPRLLRALPPRGQGRDPRAPEPPQQNASLQRDRTSSPRSPRRSATRRRTSTRTRARCSGRKKCGSCGPASSSSR